MLYADVGFRGELVLNNNQVVLRRSSLRKAEFNISGFCDFVTPETSLGSIRGISEADHERLQSIADKLEDGARRTVHPPHRRVVLNTSDGTGDGWKITLTKDEHDTAGATRHTGIVEKSNGSGFEIGELRDILEGLRYFFAFTMVKYCFPSVIVGYDANRRETWGEVGQFRIEQQRPLNWFQQKGELPAGVVLEQCFPKFWRKWLTNRNELIAVIDCYVSSQAMEQSGILRDSVAKSCAGLEVLAGLVLGKTIRGNASSEIAKVLRCYKIPYRCLDSSQNPVTHKLCSDLNVSDNSGAQLIVNIRNYIVHPLDINPVIKPGHLQYIDGDVVHYIHLQDLCQFYLEYTLLGFCGHKVTSHRKLLEDRS